MRLHVVVAVITDTNKCVLLAKRPQHLHQGGLWEFPGGKVEYGETVEQALIRELHEELGITATEYSPLIQIPFDYPDRSVLLDVWYVTAYSGNPEGREGQTIEWISKSLLHEYDMPAANLPIVNALYLPDTYLITPEPGSTEREWTLFLSQLNESISSNGIKLVQFRAKHLSAADYVELGCRIIDLCHKVGCQVLYNPNNDLIDCKDADGVHMSSSMLISKKVRDIPQHKLLAASCHNADELNHASELGCDFSVLSPVKYTKSHLGETPLGWVEFQRICVDSTIPVYALGGLSNDDLLMAKWAGAQGIAGISGLWKNN